LTFGHEQPPCRFTTITIPSPVSLPHNHHHPSRRLDSTRLTPRTTPSHRPSRLTSHLPAHRINAAHCSPGQLAFPTGTRPPSFPTTCQPGILPCVSNTSLTPTHSPSHPFSSSRTHELLQPTEDEVAGGDGQGVEGERAQAGPELGRGEEAGEWVCGGLALRWACAGDEAVIYMRECLVELVIVSCVVQSLRAG
jgi:hypothetical protein